MARKLRVAPIGISQHVIQRGNNRQDCFGADEDREAYLAFLRLYATKFSVEVHAWVLMTNHVHLLCTPRAPDAVSHMMQSIGRSYVGYFNQRYQRSGTLWEGRYKSCLVDSEAYLLQLYRYIELNPVRAGMVSMPSEYVWSSYACNALGKPSDMRTFHECYLALGRTQAKRMARYRAMVNAAIDELLVEEIRRRSHQGVALGDDRFASQIEALTGQRVTNREPGRPKTRTFWPA
jgi:putative transposase